MDDAKRDTVRVRLEDSGWVDLPIGTPDNPLTHADLDGFVARVEAARADHLKARMSADTIIEALDLAEARGGDVEAARDVLAAILVQRELLAEALRDLGQDDFVSDVLEGRYEGDDAP